MRKPNIIYCNVIREDDKQGQVAIKGRHIEEMTDALIECYCELEAQVNTWGARKEQHDMYSLLIEVEEALKKAGVEL